MKTADQLIKDAKNKIQEVTVQQLHEQWLTHKDLILIDVREPEEHQQASIDRSVNFPRGVLEMKIAQHPAVSHHCEVELALEELAKKDIYLICRTGGRSALATVALQDMGFTQLYSVQGGMQAWIDAALPTT